ncbi:response regulator transcription factor [Bacillus alkalicellulosilyticus]|uniref:response regulator transcription factor n=1 Tax=Alkalihalobacterium alkalicellulosilyticum TaxID=1912214 RepID=UPI000997859E|nr:response regulator transcription factor [Bacillus alkalicellulosilyticus]
MNNILVIDEQSNYRDGVKNLLEISFSNCVVDTYSSVSEFESTELDITPDIVIIDPSNSLNNYQPTINKFIEWGVKVVLLTLESEKEKHWQFVLKDVQGYLVKDMSTPELLTNLKDISNGNRRIHPTVANVFLERFQESLQANQRFLNEKHDM